MASLLACHAPSPCAAVVDAGATRATAAARPWSVVSAGKSGNEIAMKLRWSESVGPRLRGLGARVSVKGSGEPRRGLVCMVLPTGKAKSKTASQELPWEARAVKSFSMAELEARKLKYPSTGTESLLLGILTEGTSEAARFLRKNGVTLFGAKDEIIKLLGKADMYFFSPEHPPLTSSAQKALDWAIDPKNRPEGSSGEELSTTMMVLGIWAQKGSAGQKVLENLGINDEKLAELAATMKTPASKKGSYQQLVQ